jgi:hypothetical protein
MTAEGAMANDNKRSGLDRRAGKERRAAVEKRSDEKMRKDGEPQRSVQLKGRSPRWLN